MTYRGTVRSGAIVLDGPVELPEGATVEVIVAEPIPPREAVGGWPGSVLRPRSQRAAPPMIGPGGGVPTPATPPGS